MNPGEYSQPLVRNTFVQVPVISGYVAARLQAQDWFQPTVSGGANNMLVTYKNVGNTFFAVRLQETSDRSVSGVRTVLPGTEVVMCPGGQATFLSTNKARYLEVFCTGTTTGSLRMQIDSQRQWNVMAFDKIDDNKLVPGSPYGTTLYPKVLWQGSEQPPYTATP